MNLLPWVAYGGYIWSCYGLTLAMLIFSAWSARRSLREQIGAAKRRVEMQKEDAHDMTPRRRRMVLVGLIVLGVGAAAAFALTAFQDNLLYYYPPSDVAAGKAPADRVFRLGGMVEEGSFKREAGQHGSALRGHGLRAGRDRELQRRVAGSVSRRAGRDCARPARMRAACSSPHEVLAKHDENYMPPAVAESLRKQHRTSAPDGDCRRRS